MRQLWSDNLANLATNYTIQPGKFEFILIRYTGVAQTGQTVALTDLGTTRLNNNSADKINLDGEALSEMADNYGGYVEATSASGGAFAFSIFLPAGYWFDPKNNFWFSKSDQGYIALQYANFTATLIVSGNVTIYAKPGVGVQSYWHKILSKQVVNSAGATGVITDIIPDKNVIALYLKDPAALIDNFTLIRDGATVVQGAIGAELAYSNWIHQIEVASLMYISEFVQNRNLVNALSNNFSYQYIFNNSGNLEQYYSSIEFTPDRQKASIGG